MNPRGHRHQSILVTRAAKLARVLAILFCLAAVIDFTYFAYRTSQCYTDNPDPLNQEAHPRSIKDTAECHENVALSEIHMRLDAAAVLLGIALIIAAGVQLSDARRNTKRLLLGIEAAVLLLIVAYSLLLMSAWH